MVVFGGASETAPLNDLHLLDLADADRPNWQQIKCGSPSPPPREMHTATLWTSPTTSGPETASFGTVVVIGGRVESGEVLNDVWWLRQDKGAWRWNAARTGMPSPRCAHAAALVEDELLLFGGIDGAGLPNHLICLGPDKETWVVVEDADGEVPAPRFGHAAVQHPAGMLVFGGINVTDDHLDTTQVSRRR